jgi:hypothetical protein
MVPRLSLTWQYPKDARSARLRSRAETASSGISSVDQLSGLAETGVAKGRVLHET